MRARVPVGTWKHATFERGTFECAAKDGNDAARAARELTDVEWRRDVGPHVEGEYEVRRSGRGCGHEVSSVRLKPDTTTAGPAEAGHYACVRLKADATTVATTELTR
jgi:hypothetical protein